MNLLSIDTSTQTFSLAVSRDGEILKYRNIKLNRPLSSSIIPGIKKLLEDANVPLAKLDGFAVGLGPGSFTSLRVGLSTIKGLAFALHKPVVGIPSLDILAMNAPEGHAQVCVLCDAKRNLVYACLFDKQAGKFERKSEHLLTDIRDVLKRIKGEVLFIGDGIELFKTVILKEKGIHPHFLDAKEGIPQARFLALLALQKFREGKHDPIDELVPLYLYPDHCQIKKK